ncbi:hypothetical protein B566_EDAN017959 [Ephemera danica]|nr:hypothetical protein B566_EDAN017959 [Ephemera danica]
MALEKEMEPSSSATLNINDKMSFRKRFSDLSRSQANKRLRTARLRVCLRRRDDPNSSSDEEPASTSHDDSHSNESTAESSNNPSPKAADENAAQEDINVAQATLKVVEENYIQHNRDPDLNSIHNASDSEQDDFGLENNVNVPFEDNSDQDETEDLQFLPKTRGTLVHTSRLPVVLQVMPPGMYHHFGMKNGVILAIEESYSELENGDTIEVMVNCDGVSLNKSNCEQFFTILGHSLTLKGSSVFKIGIYHGSSKPDNVESFFRAFINECKDLVYEGVDHGGKHFHIIVVAFVCDLPAQAFILNVKGHNGYNSCTKCKVVGKTINHTTCFYNFNSTLRTDVSFRAYEDEEHHNGPTPMVEIPRFDMIRGNPKEPFHMKYVGCTKKVVTMIFGKRSPHRFPIRTRDEVSQEMKRLAQHIPFEFQRRPQDLILMDKFKGTEWRLFLLYIGAIVLKKNLDGSQHNLDVATVILSKPASNEEITYAETLFENFVRGFKNLYGEQYVSQNIHGLLHIGDDVRSFGPLENFSAFRFENENRLIRNVLKNSGEPLKQLVKRHEEKILCGGFKKKDPPIVGYKLSQPATDGIVVWNCGDIMLKLGYRDKSAVTKALSKPLYKANDPNTLANYEMALTQCLRVSLEIAKSKADEDGRRNYVGSLTSDCEEQPRRKTKPRLFEDEEFSPGKSVLPKAPKSPGSKIVPKASTATKTTISDNPGSTTKWQVSSPVTDRSRIEATKKTLFRDVVIATKEKSGMEVLQTKNATKSTPDKTTDKNQVVSCNKKTDKSVVSPLKQWNEPGYSGNDVYEEVVNINSDDDEDDMVLGKNKKAKPGPSQRDVYQKLATDIESDEDDADCRPRSKKMKVDSSEFVGDGSTWSQKEFQRFMVAKIRRIEAQHDVLLADVVPKKESKFSPSSTDADNSEQKLSTHMDIMQLDSLIGDEKARKQWVRAKDGFWGSKELEELWKDFGEQGTLRSYGRILGSKGP